MSVQKGRIALDYSHNNKLTMESSSYSDFIQFLFNSGFKIGKIQAGFDSMEKLENYDLIFLSPPRSAKFSEEEINNIEEYVKNGGSLLILSSGGGDYKNRTNTNRLAERFKFKFISDEVNDSMNYSNLQKRPILSDFKPHNITNGINKVVLSSACSLDVQEYIEKDQSISIDILIRTGLNAWHKVYDGENWKEEDIPNNPLMVAIEYFEGRVIAFGSMSLFSSFGREYGFYGHDNNILIGNALKWLIEKESSEEKLVTITLNRQIFQWVEQSVKKDKWGSFSDLVNVGIKFFKDNYDSIMKQLEAIHLARKEAHEREKKEKEDAVVEDDMIDLIPKRKKGDLIDIISTLEEITGEEYELSIDLDRLEMEENMENSTEKFEKEEVEKEAVNSIDDKTLMEEFENETGKNAVWQGKITQQYKDWVQETYGINEDNSKDNS